MNQSASHGTPGAPTTVGYRVEDQHQRKPWTQPRLHASPVKLTLHDDTYGDVDSPGEDPDNFVDGSKDRLRL